MNCVLAGHQVAPGLNLNRDILSLLLRLWTVLRSNPSSAKSKRFRKCSAAEAQTKALQKFTKSKQKTSFSIKSFFNFQIIRRSKESNLWLRRKKPTVLTLKPALSSTYQTFSQALYWLETHMSGWDSQTQTLDQILIPSEAGAATLQRMS